MRVISLFTLLFILTQNSFALREARPTPIDSRIRVMVYNPDDVFKFIGYYGYQASIELSQDESVVSISMGDTTAWQVMPSGNRIFIKPTESEATTNMTLITNKRTYFFELHAENAAGIQDPDMVFNVKFIYPDQEDEILMASMNNSSSDSIDISHPENFNFNYSVSGSDIIAPVEVFDDGQSMYLRFRSRNATTPSFFAVSDDLRESMVNYHMSPDGKYIVIERVYKKLTIRDGDEVTCLFNEAFVD